MKTYPFTQKLLKKYILANSVHIGTNKRDRNFFNKKDLYKTKSNLDIIKIEKIIINLKKIIPPLSRTAARKGTIWIVKKDTAWTYGQLSNIKKQKKLTKFPSFIAIFNQQKQEHIYNEINSLQIPSTTVVNTDKNPKSSFYKMAGNTNYDKSLEFLSSIVNHVVKFGHIRRFNHFKKKSR